MRVPAYRPPSDRRASVAVGTSPLIVLLAFTLVVCRWMDPDTGLAWALACALWVSYEMHDFQRLLDAYNLAYAHRHLEGQSNEALAAVVDDPSFDAPTRDFVARFLAAGREVLPDGCLH